MTVMLTFPTCRESGPRVSIMHVVHAVVESRKLPGRHAHPASNRSRKKKKINMGGWNIKKKRESFSDLLVSFFSKEKNTQTRSTCTHAHKKMFPLVTMESILFPTERKPDKSRQSLIWKPPSNDLSTRPIPMDRLWCVPKPSPPVVRTSVSLLEFQERLRVEEQNLCYRLLESGQSYPQRPSRKRPREVTPNSCLPAVAVGLLNNALFVCELTPRKRTVVSSFPVSRVKLIGNRDFSLSNVCVEVPIRDSRTSKACLLVRQDAQDGSFEMFLTSRTLRVNLDVPIRRWPPRSCVIRDQFGSVPGQLQIDCQANALIPCVKLKRLGVRRAKPQTEHVEGIRVLKFENIHELVCFLRAPATTIPLDTHLRSNAILHVTDSLRLHFYQSVLQCSIQPDPLFCSQHRLGPEIQLALMNSDMVCVSCLVQPTHVVATSKLV